MALILSGEEEQFRDSVRRVVAERSPLSKLRELMSSGQPYDADVWKQLSALGLPALIVPAEHGGAEAGYSVLSVALGELGAGLVASPLLASTLAAGTLLRLGDEAAQARLLPGIASGELIATLAAGGTGTARADGDALTGEISPVLNAAQAGVLLVPADRRPTAPRCCSRSTPRRRACRSRRCPRSITAARSPGSGWTARRAAALDGDAAAALGFAQDLANLALASEQLGAMAACLLMTAEYAKIRIAFGRPIGSFQGSSTGWPSCGPPGSWRTPRCGTPRGRPTSGPLTSRAPRRSRGSRCPPATSTPRSRPFSCTAASASPGSTTRTCTRRTPCRSTRCSAALTSSSTG